MSHFYLSQKTRSSAVCAKCCTLYIPGSNVTVEFIDHIPKTKNLYYKLNKNEKSKDFILYTCRVCLAKTVFSGRKLVVKSVASKKKKSLLKEVLKKEDKQVGFELLDFLKSV